MGVATSGTTAPARLSLRGNGIGSDLGHLEGRVVTMRNMSSWFLRACPAVVLLVACEASSVPGDSGAPEDAACTDPAPACDASSEPGDSSAPDDAACTPDCAGRCDGADDGCGSTCSENLCNGCCTDASVCMPGTANDACGAIGERCSACLTHEVCDELVCEPLPPPVPPEDLPSYLEDHGIAFVGPHQLDGMGDDFLYVPYPDPSDTETMVAFFELDTGTPLDTSPMHFAASLRGPDPSRTIPYYGGRGIAFGHLGSFDGCTDLGYFLEDFGRNALMMPEMQMTYCKDSGFTAHTVYRVDMRVSQSNTYAAIWRKVDADTYVLEAEAECTTEPGPFRDIGPCPEHSTDEPFGGFFVGSGFSGPTDTWQVRNVFVGHW